MSTEHKKRLRYLDVLELPEDATPLEVKSAYQSLKSLYTKGSIALTPIEDDCPQEVKQQIVSQVEEAYLWLTANPAVPKARFDHGGQSEGESDDPLKLPFDDGQEPKVYDGPTLKAIRQRLGIELSEVEFATKIGMNHIISMEEEKFKSLPEAVFVRGYIASYAKCLGLDAPKVTAQYMKRYKKGS